MNRNTVKRRRWRNIVTVLAAFVVFCTTYALILPAITWDRQLICELPEHTHSDDCWEEVRIVDESELICGKEEHIHDGDCYSEQQILVCKRKHDHDESCYVTQLVLECPKELHMHSGECYRVVSEHTEQILVCGMEEHLHTELCFDAQAVEKPDYLCRMIEHTHTEACYLSDGVTLQCTIPEHGHTILCTSDHGADTEDAAAWDESFASAVLTGYAREDIAAIAATQLGYTESARNLGLNQVNEVSGYTRYGAWYGNPYADWNTTFCAFCISHGGANTFPFDADAETWMTLLEERSLLRTPEGYEPKASDVVFYRNADGALRTGIVCSQPGEPLCWIEGDDAGAVTEKSAGDAAELLGFGEIPDVYGVRLMAAPMKLMSASPNGSGPFTVTMSGGTITGLTFTVESPTKDTEYVPQYSDTNGASWVGDNNAKVKSAKNEQNLVPVTLDFAAAISDPASIPADRILRVYAQKDTATSAGQYTFYDVLDSVTPGFGSWVTEHYMQDFGGPSLPTTLAEIGELFVLYSGYPYAALSTERIDGDLWVSADVTPAGNYIYEWQYRNANGEWVTLIADSVTTFDASQCDELMHGGRNVRLKLLDAADSHLVAFSDTMLVNPMREIYDDAIAEINELLDLDTYRVYYGDNGQSSGTYDLSIHGNRFDNYFYFGLFEDSVPFHSADEYADYLARIYLEDGIDKVQKTWEYYLYNMYDPMYDVGEASDSLPEGYDYGEHYSGTDGGDHTIMFIKDQSSSSFHATKKISDMVSNATDDSAKMIQSLDYDFLNENIDYDHFVSDLSKTATAAAAGDANAERRYTIDLSADAQAKATAPVAMILQIQTSWQMFDLPHADYGVISDVSSIGSSASIASEDDMANLYEIRQGLELFVDYMQRTYPGNNLVLGITETKHGGSNTMFYTPYTTVDSRGRSTTNYYYVSNNPEYLKLGLQEFDVFGNCEHVHYDSDELRNALEYLPKNLLAWQDTYGAPITYDAIQKVAVIIGGATENSTDENGTGAKLPWGTESGKFNSMVDPATGSSTKTSSGDATPALNAVYGIKTVTGTTKGSQPYVSWLDNANNSEGTAFRDGVGDAWTKMITATSANAVFEALKYIAETEMMKKGMDILAADKYVSNVTVEDTVTDEFELDLAKPIVASVYNSSVHSDGSLFMRSAIDPLTGAVTFTTFVGGEEVSATVNGSREEVTDEQGLRTVTITFTENQPYQFSKTNEDGDLEEYIGYADVTQTLVLQENADHTTDVTFNFGRVYNTKKCDLTFDIVAKEDYIGSNNVFTNVGTPDLAYQHIMLDEEGNATTKVENFNRLCTQTPQVNVPVLIDAADGSKKKVQLNTEVSLTDTDLHTERITAWLEEILENYDQTNGTVTYTWEFPDGTTSECGSAHVTGGELDASLPDTIGTYIADTVGVNVLKLRVEFEPDTVVNSGFFSDTVTAAAVGAKSDSGRVWIEAVDPNTPMDYYVRKQWVAMQGCSGIEFRLSDGHGGFVAADTDGWTITETEEDAYTFEITQADDWQIMISGLPSVKNGNVILDYVPVETPVPGFTTSYDEAIQTDEKWEGHVSVGILPNFDIDKDAVKMVHYIFTYNNSVYEGDLPIALNAKISKNTTAVVPLDLFLPLTSNSANGAAYSFEDLDIFLYKNKKIENGVIKYEGQIKLDKDKTLTLSFSVSPEKTGTKDVPVMVIRNTPSGRELPSTGGHGRELLYSLCAAVFAGGLAYLLVPMQSRKKKPALLLRLTKLCRKS